MKFSMPSEDILPAEALRALRADKRSGLRILYIVSQKKSHWWSESQLTASFMSLWMDVSAMEGIYKMTSYRQMLCF